MTLTNENYYSNETNREYMSVSQYKQFQKCEAAAMAQIKGEWQIVHLLSAISDRILQFLYGDIEAAADFLDFAKAPVVSMLRVHKPRACLAADAKTF